MPIHIFIHQNPTNLKLPFPHADYICAVVVDEARIKMLLAEMPDNVQHTVMMGKFPLFIVELPGEFHFWDKEPPKLPTGWSAVYRLDHPWEPSVPWTDEMGVINHWHPSETDE